MNIPEYNQRIIADSAKRTLNDVKEPQEFRDVSSQVKLSKELSKATDVAGDVFIQMKKQRDLGIVNQFMNDFEVERIRKIHELKNIYKGADSMEIVNAYQQWQDDYTVNRIGQSQAVPEGTLYLENNEQIEEVQKQLAGSLNTTINSLSSYASASLNEYANQQADGRIFKLTEQIAREDNLENVDGYSRTISYLVGQRYPDAPSSYIEMQTKKILDKAYTADLNRMSSADPQQAMLAIQTPLFQKNMLADSITTAKGSMIKDLIEQESARVAEQRARGFDVELTINPQMYEAISPVLKEYGEEKFKSEVLEKAKGKQAAFNRSVRDSQNDFLNTKTAQAITLMNAVSDAPNGEVRSRATDNMVMLSAELKRTPEGSKLAMELQGTNEGMNQYQELKMGIRNLRATRAAYRDETSRAQYMDMVDDLRNQKQQIQMEASDVSRALSRIDSGEYSNYSDLINEDWHPVNKAMVFQKIASAQKYRTLDNQARNAGYKLDTKVQKAFKSATGYEYTQAPALYGKFKTYIKDEILSYHNETKKYPDDAVLSGLASSANANMLSSNEGLSSLLQVSALIPSMSKDIKKNEGFIFPEALLERLVDGMSDGPFNNLLDTEKKTIAKYILEGNLNAAEILMKEASDD